MNAHTTPAPGPQAPTTPPAPAPGTTAAQGPGAAWAQLLADWSACCRTMGPQFAAYVDARCAAVAPLLAGPLADVHPDDVSPMQLYAALCTVTDAEAYRTARAMLDALLADHYRHTTPEASPMHQVPADAPAHLPEPTTAAAEAPATTAPAQAHPEAPHAPQPTRRRGHLSLITATA